MNDKEKEVLTKVLKEMKDAYGITAFWLKGSPIEQTLGSWIKSLEELLDDALKGKGQVDNKRVVATMQKKTLHLCGANQKW